MPMQALKTHINFVKPKKLNQKGVSSIEFVLVLPILLSILLGIIEYGWLFKAQMDLNNAVSIGARTVIKQEILGSAFYAIYEALNDDYDIPTPEHLMRGYVTVSNLTNPSRVSVVYNRFSHSSLTGFFPSALLPSSLTAKAVMAYP